MCRSEEMKTAADLIQAFPLSVEQRCQLTLVRQSQAGASLSATVGLPTSPPPPPPQLPANLRNMEVRLYFFRFMEQYVAGVPVRAEHRG